MIFETIKTEGLSHFSYLIGDEEAGVGVVIDPRRDVDIYLELAQQHQVRIDCILETHIHADFVSGSRELAAKTGAPISVGASEAYGFAHQPLHDGDTFEIGAFQLKVLHTPGHTPEHICFLISGGQGGREPWGLFSGDTLFAGEVGRPDLLGDNKEKKLAGQLYESVFNKLLPLGDEIIIYPAHGEGSACGSSIGDRQTSTIGYERRYNSRLQVEDEGQFIKQVLDSLSPAPRYYPRMKQINAEGPELIKELPYIPALTPDRFQHELTQSQTILVDTREIVAFAGAHVAGAFSIALRPAFPMWAGWLLPPEARLLLILEDEWDLETIQRHLLRIGYRNVGGYLRQGMRSWIEAGQPFEQTSQLSVHELHKRITAGDEELQVLDVRSDEEWEEGHIPTATHRYLPFLEEDLAGLDRTKAVATYCGSGYRSSMAASILQRNGFRQVYNIPGSMTAWKSANLPLENG